MCAGYFLSLKCVVLFRCALVDFDVLFDFKREDLRKGKTATAAPAQVSALLLLIALLIVLFIALSLLPDSRSARRESCHDASPVFGTGQTGT